MIMNTDAERIMREVRSFYAAGVKSGNKVYITGADPSKYVPLSDPFDRKWQGWNNAIVAQKAARRNENALLAMRNRPAAPVGGAESFYDFGRRIYNGGKRAEFTSGNCMEMAAVAAVIAIDEYHFAPDWIYMASISAPGDHAFCLLSMRRPAWGQPSEMVRGSGAAAAFVIDPWLNTACEADTYWAAVQDRVAKWAADGKRIAWSGKSGASPGWYSPDGSYARAFARSPLDFIPVKRRL